MIHPEHIPDIADNELLARFILNSNEKRADGKVSHKLFMPYKWVELSDELCRPVASTATQTRLAAQKIRAAIHM